MAERILIRTFAKTNDRNSTSAPNINMRESLLYLLCFVVACQLIGCGSGVEQRQQLAELEEQNHSGQPMLNDTLAETLVAYFDRHGNANERNHNYYTARQVRLIAEYLCID